MIFPKIEWDFYPSGKRSSPMSNNPLDAKSEERIVFNLAKIPFLGFYARTRGEAFVLSWFHRIAGIGLVIFLWMHLLTSFTTPALYNSSIGLFALAILLIYHSLNGGRLILFEVFGVRNDGSMIRWVWGLSFLYILFLGLFMVIGNQEVSAFLFWSVMFVCGLILCFGVAFRIWRTEHAMGWKLQRITGAFLLTIAPAHIAFTHLNLSAGQQANAAIIRMQGIFINVVDLALLVGVLYHGGYGLISVLGDYLSSRLLRIGAALVITFLMALCAWLRFL
jgi:succinate dehydrogenase hydrophobic anchor subunit